MSGPDAAHGKGQGAGGRMGCGPHSPTHIYDDPTEAEYQMEHISTAAIKNKLETLEHDHYLARVIQGRSLNVFKMEMTCYLMARQVFKGENVVEAVDLFETVFMEAKVMAKHLGVTDTGRLWANLQSAITRFHHNDWDTVTAVFNFKRAFGAADLAVTMFEPLMVHAKEVDEQAERLFQAVYLECKRYPEDFELGKRPKRVPKPKDLTMSSVTGATDESSSSDSDDSDGDDGRDVPATTTRNTADVVPTEEKGGERSNGRSPSCATAVSLHDTDHPAVDHAVAPDVAPEDFMDISAFPAPSIADPQQQLSDSGNPYIVGGGEGLRRLHQLLDVDFDTQPPVLTPESSILSGWHEPLATENVEDSARSIAIEPAGSFTLSSLRFPDMDGSLGVEDEGMGMIESGQDREVVFDRGDSRMDDILMGESSEVFLDRIAREGARKRSLEMHPLDDLFVEGRSRVKRRCAQDRTEDYLGLDEERVEGSRSTHSDTDLDLNGEEENNNVQLVDKTKKKKGIWGRVKSIFKRKKAPKSDVSSGKKAAPKTRPETVAAEETTTAARRAHKRSLTLDIEDVVPVSPTKRSRGEDDHSVSGFEEGILYEFDTVIVRGYMHGASNYFSDLPTFDARNVGPAESTPVQSEAACSFVTDSECARTIVRDVTLTESIEESIDRVHGVVDTVEHLIATVASTLEGPPEAGPSDSAVEFMRHVSQLLGINMDLDRSDPFDFIGDGRASELSKED